METLKQYFRVDRREISFLKFIIEAYEGIAVLTTIDPQHGIVELNIAPGCEAEVSGILRDLSQTMLIEPENRSEPMH